MELKLRGTPEEYKCESLKMRGRFHAMCRVYLISEKVGLLVAHFDVHNLKNIKTVHVVISLK
jgi:hypothetical protein